MTSLLPALPRTYPHLVPHPDNKQKKIYAKIHPIYHTGVPTHQYYDLTLLKKSNIRSNDQLLPRPTQVDMSKIKIDRSFPAEHPYSSHISRFAMFPSFTMTSDYYKTGTKQQQRPLHPQIPANPCDITIHQKSKGNGYRRETQHLPQDSAKTALCWPGDKFFQQVKTPTSGKQRFYPIPPKAVLPNHAPRQLDHTVNPRIANALRNIERSHWVTTYSKHFAGYGPSNSLLQDNVDEKVDKEQRVDIEDYTLVNEHQSLPSEACDSFQDPVVTKQWLHHQTRQHPDGHLQKIEEKKISDLLDPKHNLSLTPKKEKEAGEEDMRKSKENYLKKMAQKQKQEIKAIAEWTWWEQAEKQKHHDDLQVLKRKVNYAAPILQPAIYYDTLHTIYSTRPPFYYDGNNPYEHDYITPWDKHKTDVAIDYDYNKGVLKDMMKEELNAGKNLYVMPKYTKSQLVNEMPRLGTSVAQKPAAQSSYKYSYSPESIKTAIKDIDKYDVKELSNSLPSIVNTKKTMPSQNGTKKCVTISNKAQVATGGGDLPLNITDTITGNPNKTTNLYNLAFNPYADWAIDGYHSNPDGACDTQCDWFPGSPCGPSNRPQTKLLNLQNSFTETGIRRKFHQMFPENTCDLRHNIKYGKKHEFQGLNTCEMR